MKTAFTKERERICNEKTKRKTKLTSYNMPNYIYFYISDGNNVSSTRNEMQREV